MRRGSFAAATGAVFWTALLTLGRRGSAVQVEDLGQGAAAHRAERARIAREHDAVGLRPEEAARLVVGSLEGAHLPGVPLGPEQGRLLLALGEEERVHLGLRPPLGSDALALLLVLPGTRRELVLAPRSGDGRAGRGERPPLEARRV